MEDKKMGTFYVDKEQGLLVLEEEDGEKDYYTIHHDVMVEGRRYMILIREGEGEGEQEEEGGVLRVEQRGEEQFFSVVEEERELYMVEKALEEEYVEEE